MSTTESSIKEVEIDLAYLPDPRDREETYYWATGLISGLMSHQEEKFPRGVQWVRKDR